MANIDWNVPVKETATCTWTIDNFQNLTSHAMAPNSFSPPNSKHSFWLYLDPKPQLGGVDYLILCLAYHGNDPELLLKYRVSILDTKDEKRHTKGNSN